MKSSNYLPELCTEKSQKHEKKQSSQLSTTTTVTSIGEYTQMNHSSLNSTDAANNTTPMSNLQPSSTLLILEALSHSVNQSVSLLRLVEEEVKALTAANERLSRDNWVMDNQMKNMRLSLLKAESDKEELETELRRLDTKNSHPNDSDIPF